MIDESLVEKRAVVRIEPDPLGFIVHLSCGHTVWCAVEPRDALHCGECLYILVNQARELQAQQIRPGGG